MLAAQEERRTLLAEKAALVAEVDILRIILCSHGFLLRWLPSKKEVLVATQFFKILGLGWRL